MAIPFWAKEMVIAQREYERAKARSYEAIAECDAAERHLLDLSLIKRKWEEEQMALALAAMEASDAMDHKVDEV